MNLFALDLNSALLHSDHTIPKESGLAIKEDKSRGHSNHSDMKSYF